MMSSVPVRVVVADPQPVFRYGLKHLLDSTEHLRVVGEAADPSEAAETMRDLQPDVVVVTQGEGAGWLEPFRGVRGLRKPVRYILVTYGDPASAPLASELPVACMLPRDSTGGAFVNCIECVMQHQCWPERHIGAAVAPPPAAPPKPESKRRYGLTSREAQIVAAVADGASNKDIAAHLTIAEDTVKHHMSNIFDKVGVHSRLELAVFALYHGVVQRT
jgi:two-component system nitrate/nitrite response regulator NarL